MLSFGRIDLYQNANWLLLVPFSSTSRLVESSILISRRPPEIFSKNNDPIEQFNSLMKSEKYRDFFTKMQRISKNLSVIYPNSDNNRNETDNDPESPQAILQDKKTTEEIIKKLFIVRKLKIDEQEFQKLSLTMESKNTVYGLLGTVFLPSGPFLIVVSEKERMGEFNFCPFIEKKSGKSSVQKITKVEFVPILGNFSKKYSERYLSVDQREKQTQYLNYIQKIFGKDGGFIYSCDMNLTLTLQKMTEEVVKFKEPLQEFWKMSDFSFFWNRFFSVSLFLSDLHGYILPVVRGHFHQFSIEVSKKKLPRRGLGLSNSPSNSVPNSPSSKSILNFGIASGITTDVVEQDQNPNANIVVNEAEDDFREVEELFDSVDDPENAEKAFQNVILGNSPSSATGLNATMKDNLNNSSSNISKDKNASNSSKNGVFIDLGMLSRISCDRFGPRYLSRGADSKGNVSNFVETEQFIFDPRTKKLFCFLIIRGSIPLIWKQQPNLTLVKSDISLLNSKKAQELAFANHFQHLAKKYSPCSPLTVINLCKQDENDPEGNDYKKFSEKKVNVTPFFTMNAPNFSSIGTALETIDSMEISIPLGILAKGASDLLGGGGNSNNNENNAIADGTDNSQQDNSNYKVSLNEPLSKTKSILKGLFENKNDKAMNDEIEKRGGKVDKEVLLSKLYFSFLNSTGYANQTHYVSFDFHKYCQNFNFKNLKHFVEKIQTDIQEMSFFSCEFPSNQKLPTQNSQNSLIAPISTIKPFQQINSGISNASTKPPTISEIFDNFSIPSSVPLSPQPTKPAPPKPNLMLLDLGEETNEQKTMNTDERFSMKKGNSKSNLLNFDSPLASPVPSSANTFNSQRKLNFQTKQNGVFRVNCIDCCDRTNIVQMFISKRVLKQQLVSLGIIKENENIESFGLLNKTFHFLWATNGDVISLLYSGSKAMGSKITLVGGVNTKVSVASLFENAKNSVKRYLQNNFFDQEKHLATAYVLGSYDILMDKAID